MWLWPALAALVLAAWPAAAQEDPSWARTERYRGSEAFQKQDFETALKLFEDAQRIYERSLGETSRENIDTLTDVANTLNRLQRPVDAVPVLERLVMARTAKDGERDERTLNALSQLGTAYFQAARPTEAVATNQRLLALSTAVRGERNPATILALRDLGIFKSSLGGYDAALPDLVKAMELRIAVLGPTDPMTLSVMNDVGNAYYFTGNYPKALEAYERIVKIKLDQGGEDATANYALRALALVYGSMGRAVDALPIYERLYRQAVAKYGEASGEGVFALGDLAGAYAGEGRMAEAVPMLEKAIALRAKLTGRALRDSEFLIGILGNFYDRVGRSAEAIPLLQQAVDAQVAQWGERSFTVWDGRRSIALALQHAGRRAEATPLLEAILKARTELQGPGHPSTVQALRDLADAYEADGRSADAMPLYERMVVAVEALRAHGDLSSDNRQALFAQWVQAYKNLARLRLARGDEAGAFELAELSKARTLLESTAFRRAAQSAELSADERLRLQGYEPQLADLGDRIAATTEPSARLILEARRDALVREQAAFRAELAAHHPKYAQLSDVAIVGAEAGRSRLQDDTVLLSYLIVGDTPIAFTLSRRDGLRARVLPAFPELAKTVAEFRDALMDAEAWRSPDTPANRLARALAERLLAPLASGLHGQRHWIVSPDGALATLPFETLPFEGKPAIATHDVSYIQSLSMLALLMQRDAEYRSLEGRKTLLAMGGAQYDAPAAAGTAPAAAPARGVDIGAYVRRNAGDAHGVQRAFDLLGVHWPDLPGSEREVDTVARLFQGQPIAVYTKADASEATLQRLNAAHELAAYRWLLFSTHGYLSTEEPALSAIVLSQRDKAEGTDGYVTASEWPAYDLRSDLIVLSACETALGKVVQGEGVMGLPYALYVAGNRNTVLSLWPVVDESTAAFMARLFELLGQGKTQVEALNQTKREFIAGDKYAAPVFWAPFVLYGS